MKPTDVRTDTLRRPSPGMREPVGAADRASHVDRVMFRASKGLGLRRAGCWPGRLTRPRPRCAW
jgi:hypothetical protein